MWCKEQYHLKLFDNHYTKESQENEIHLNDTNPEAFMKVLEYLYTKDLSVVGPTMPIELMIETFSLASQYNVEPLKYKLGVMLSMNITVENVCQLLLLADAHQCVEVQFNRYHFFNVDCIIYSQNQPPPS